jgi:hypothetical protein
MKLKPTKYTWECNHINSAFVILADKYTKVFDLLKGLYAPEEDVKNFEELNPFLAFELKERNPKTESDIINIFWQKEEWQEERDAAFLNHIAPFVEDTSYLEFKAWDGYGNDTHWRTAFRYGKTLEQAPVIAWKDI